MAIALMIIFLILLILILLIGLSVVIIVSGFFIVAIVITIVLSIDNKKQKKIQRQKAIETQKEKQERIRKQKEEEWKKSTKCVICGECSMGKYICENCYNRSMQIIDEIKKSKKENTYENILKSYKSLHYKVVNATNRQDRTYFASKLVATSLILKYDYYVKETSKETYCFLQDLYDINYLPDDNFLNKYREFNLNNKSEADEKRVFNTSGKILKCNDGDYVRSKAEREIDNFFFANRIWHIYEYHYEHPTTKEWASPDFYLPDYNLFIEYFGLDTPEYIEKREHKIKMYRSDKSIKFEYVTFEDDADLNNKLLEICRKYNISIK